jgi:hypothetical protein
LILPVHGLQINTGDGTVIISSGDSGSVSGQIIDGSKSGFVWLYTGNYNSLIYGEPIIVSGNSYKVNINKSVSIKEGKYKMFIQFAGNNNIQEVLFDRERMKLYSPWRAASKEMDVSGNIAAVPGQIEQFCLENIKYCDDTFTNSTVVVEGPFIKFSDQYQVQGSNLDNDISKNGLLYVGGTTNIDNSNWINVTLDYTQTVQATIDGTNPYGYYKWYAHLNISQLRAGDHTILIQSSKVADMKSILSISQYIPTPKPTPTPVRYVGNEMKSFVAVTNTPSIKAAATPIVVETSNQKFVPVVTAAPKINPMVINTNVPVPVATPTPIPTKTKTPLDIMVIFGGIIVAMIILNKKTG